MFFKYPPGEVLEAPRPKRVFARVDSVEPGDVAVGDPPTVYLDCVDAEWLQAADYGHKPLWQIESGEPDRRISIIEASGYIFGTKTPPSEGDWWHIELDESEDRAVLQYFNLFSDPTARGVISVRKLTRHEQALVNDAASWKGVTPSPPKEVKKALNRLPKPDSLAVYDVGQGSCNALLSQGIPTLYFDFGGSTIGNWRSFPAHLRKFCFTQNPLIVLSHWDWDHWSSALRDHQALRATWIAPLQSKLSLGNVHARFIAMLIRSGARILWCPPGMDVLKIPGAEIFFCKGKKTNRNESGLAMMTRTPVRVLLPGDASPGNAVNRSCLLDHILVPHHGGRSDMSKLPEPTSVEHSHLIYSYGVGNIFLHPLTDLGRQVRKKWKKNLHTALRDQSGFGHVGLDLMGSRATKPHLPCGGGCHLGIVQWVEAPRPPTMTRARPKANSRRTVSVA